MDVLLTEQPLSPDQAYEHLGAPEPEEGATVVFLGTVRADRVGEDRVVGIHYEAYTEMARHQMKAILEEARERFGVLRGWMAHRIGFVPVGEVAFVVALRASHRREAFEALAWITDEVKRRVPIWKKEILESGDTRWKEEDG